MPLRKASLPGRQRVAKEPWFGGHYMQMSSCCLRQRRCGKSLVKAHPDAQPEMQSRWRTAKSAVQVFWEPQRPMTGSTRNVQPLWAELCTPGLHSDGLGKLSQELGE